MSVMFTNSFDVQQRLVLDHDADLRHQADVHRIRRHLRRAGRRQLPLPAARLGVAARPAATPMPVTVRSTAGC
jgi:hypothetical protein